MPVLETQGSYVALTTQQKCMLKTIAAHMDCEQVDLREGGDSIYATMKTSGEGPRRIARILEFEDIALLASFGEHIRHFTDFGDGFRIGLAKVA